MKKKYISIIYLIIGVFSILPIQSIAQNKIEFEKLVNDLGTFSEDSDPKVCTFKFINRQTKPIAIAQVQSTCGCAVPQYTKKVIQPGGSGEIKITYNPQGRPGRFNRSIIVSFSGQTEKTHLFVKGTVIPGAIRKNKTYPYVMGDLQLRTTGVRLRPMRADLQQQNIMVINSGENTIQVDIASTISCISATLVPTKLLPGQKGEIQIIRKTDMNKDRAYCIRLKENARREKRAGIVSIIINSEKCTQ